MMSKSQMAMLQLDVLSMARKTLKATARDEDYGFHLACGIALKYPDSQRPRQFVAACTLVRTMAGRVNNAPNDRNWCPVTAGLVLDALNESLTDGTMRRLYDRADTITMGRVLRLAGSRMDLALAEKLAQVYMAEYATADGSHTPEGALYVAAELVAFLASISTEGNPERSLDAMSIELIEALNSKENA